MELANYMEVLDFYRDKKVFITGNTGFKGAWLTHILLNVGAVVTGYSLKSPTEPNLFSIAGLGSREGLNQIYGDVRDLEALKVAFQMSNPEIVFHLAAQPIVRDSFKEPVITYSTNVMGTVNICEAIRISSLSNFNDINSENKRSRVKSFLNVTTDKVYKNIEWCWGYRETDELGGMDPYSNSKSCAELVTQSYKNSFFIDDKVRISTARAGNVIGGGDFSNDRIIPDCVRSLTNAENGEALINVRNPYSIRPYEHVLEPLFAYLMIAKAQYEDEKYASHYNVGPDGQDCVSTGDLVSLFTNVWNQGCRAPKCSWFDRAEKNAPHEANFLKLDCSKIKSVFGWKPIWHIDKAIENVIAWTKVWMDDGDIAVEMDREINGFIRDSQRE